MAEIYKQVGAYDRDEWCTPNAPYLEIVRMLFGGVIDFDPASSDHAQNIVLASTYCTKVRSAFDLDAWSGNTFMNPPYSRALITRFIDRFIAEYAQWKMWQGVVLTNNSTETSWCQKLLQASAARCYPNHRIQFEHPDRGQGLKESNRQAQIFFYFPSVNAYYSDLKRFRTLFAPLGYVAVDK